MKITKERLKQIIKEELEEVSRGRQPRLQKYRRSEDDLQSYDPRRLRLNKVHNKLKDEIAAMDLGNDLGDFPSEPINGEEEPFIKRINKRLQKAQDRSTIEKLQQLKGKIKEYTEEAKWEHYYGSVI